MLYFFVWMIRTYSIHEIWFFFKCFTSNTIHAIIHTLIYISIIKWFLEYLLNKVFMTRLCSADKVGVSDTYTIPNSLMLRCHHISIFHSSQRKCLRWFYNFLRVFINTSWKTNIRMPQSLVLCDSISNKRRVGVPNMRNSVGVVYWRCNIEFLCHIIIKTRKYNNAASIAGFF